MRYSALSVRMKSASPSLAGLAMMEPSSVFWESSWKVRPSFDDAHHALAAAHEDFPVGHDRAGAEFSTQTLAINRLARLRVHRAEDAAIIHIVE
jgi:hypothetical protein